MNQTPIQKNIAHGSITAGGNVHISDIIYNIERDFKSGSILKCPKYRGGAKYFYK